MKSPMTKREEVIPEQFLLHLQTVIPGFADEKLEDQCRLTWMVWLGALKPREHSKFAGAMSFGYDELNKSFGRGRFKTINDCLGLFEVSANWGAGLDPLSPSTYTKAYRFSDLVENARRAFLCRPTPGDTRLRMMTGDVMKTLPRAVASKDMKGVTTTAWKHAVGLNRVTVNLPMLRQLSFWLTGFRDNPMQRHDWRISSGVDESTDFPSQLLLQRLIDATGQIVEMSQTDVAGHGVCPHWYVQAASGRLYARGINLQNAPTIIKQAALAGQWEYDFSNCHYAILSQLADQYGYKCSAIADYLANKKVIRNAIAKAADISVTQAKTCLLAILYGARATEWHENAIPEEIGVKAAARLYAVPLFKGIKDDIARARKAILAGYTRNKTGGLTNAFGKSIGGKIKAEKKLAHIIQGIEAKALEAATTLYPNEIQLVQHDGFVSGSRLDPIAITDAVYDATGFRMELEEAKVWIDFDSQLKKDRFQLETPYKPIAGADLESLPVS
jgi:hypothetical protein